MTSFLSSAPPLTSGRWGSGSAPVGTTRLELPTPGALDSSSKGRASAVDSAAIDALFDDLGLQQKDGADKPKSSKGRGRPGGSSKDVKTGNIDDSPPKSTLKNAAPALSLLTSQHKTASEDDKDDLPSRPSSSYGRKQGLGSAETGKESSRSKPRVTFAEPIRDSVIDSFDTDSPLSSQAATGGLGNSNNSASALVKGRAKDQGLQGAEPLSTAGDSLDFLSVGGNTKAGRRNINGRPPTPEFRAAQSEPASQVFDAVGGSLGVSPQSHLLSKAERAPKKQAASEEVDWGDADDLLAMLPDGSKGAPQKDTSNSRSSSSLPANALAASFNVQPSAQTVSATASEPFDLNGSSIESGYTPSFLSNTGRRRSGLGLGRQRSTPLTSGLPKVSDLDALKRPMSADQARPNKESSSLLGSTRPGSANGPRDTSASRAFRTEAQDSKAPPGSSPKSEPVSKAVREPGVQRGSSLDLSEDAPFLRPTVNKDSTSSDKIGDKQQALTRPGSGGLTARPRERDGEALEQLQAEHARALERHKEELEKHQQELAAKEKRSEQEKAFFEEHHKSLEVLQKVVAQVESWSAEVHQMSEATRSDKEKGVAERAEAVKSSEASLTLREGALSAREQQHVTVTQQLEALMAALDTNVKELRSSQTEERGRLEKEHARLQELQASVLAERSAAQAELASARERLEEMLRAREEVMVQLEAERKVLAAERKALSDAREEVCLAEAELDVRIAQHEASAKSETEALERDRIEIEKVRECALEEAHAIQHERMVLEQEKAALDDEVGHVQEAARQAQAQLEEAVAIRNEAAHLHRDAEALHQDRVERDRRWESERLETEKARDGLLELRRALAEERYTLAQERRAAGDEKLEAVRMAESARLLMQQAGGTELGGRNENIPLDRRTVTAQKGKSSSKKKYAAAVKKLVRESSTLDDVLASSSGDIWVKEREQGRAYLQSQADFLARARERSAAHFGRSRDCNLEVHQTMNRSDSVPGHKWWQSMSIESGRRAKRETVEQAYNNDEVIKRSVFERQHSSTDGQEVVVEDKGEVS